MATTLKSYYTCCTHVIVDVCLVYMLITWNYNHFCRNVFGGVVLYCLQRHWVSVCTPALLSPLVSGSLKWYSRCVCCGIPGIHIHSYGLFLLMIFMNNGAYPAHHGISGIWNISVTVTYDHQITCLWIFLFFLFWNCILWLLTHSWCVSMGEEYQQFCLQHHWLVMY